MAQYCSRCKEVHSDEELCPHYAAQLKENPKLLGEAAKFTSIAAQYHLVSSQQLDTVAQGVNKLIGTNISYEGSHQYIRDLNIFKQLNLDSFNKSGVFSNAQNAQNYFTNASDGQLALINRKLSGTGQEIDWLRLKQGSLKSLFEKSSLLGEETTNAAGVDGETINRFTGKLIERTTIKAAQAKGSIYTNTKDILVALEKGTLNPTDTVVGIDGTKESLLKALEKGIDKARDSGDLDYANKLRQALNEMKVKEINNLDSVKESTKRLTDKISKGQAHSSLTMQEVSKKACQGAVIGAAVNLTISSISNYLKYKNGEITQKEALDQVGQDSLKGALVGAAMSTITLFIPGGALGFLGGMAIGIYLNAACTNVLDEIYGKGAYAAILDSSGFVYGMTINLGDYIKKIEKDEMKIDADISITRRKSNEIDKNFNEFEQIMKG